MRKNYDTLSNRPHLAVLTADGFQDMEVIVPIGYLVELVVDGNLITSRGPDDLPVFVKAIEDALDLSN